MVDIEYLERKKTEIVADHVRRCHDTNLDKAEQMVINHLDYEIKRLKAMRGDSK